MKRKCHITSTGGWALVTVILFTLLILALSAGLLSWSTTELRIDVSHKQRILARNVTEAIMEYGAAQAALQVQQITDFDASLFDPSVTATTLKLPATSFFANSNIDTNKVEIVGKVVPPPTTGRFDVTATNPSNAYSSLNGLSGRAGRVTLLARASTLPDFLGRRETIFMKRTMTVLDGPVLQYAAFYNMDFEVAPGPDLDIYGPVHCNRDIWVSKQSTTGQLSFWDKVTAFGTIHHGFKVQPFKNDGTRETAQDGTVEFKNPSGAFVNLKGSWSSWSNVWRDQYMGGTTDQSTAFRNFTNATYGDANTPSSLQSSAHGVLRRPLPGQLDNYVPDPDPTDGIIDPTFRNVPRALIERPLQSGDVEYIGPEVEKQKMARKAGLYIIVNATGAAVANVRDPAGNAISGGFLTNEYRAYVQDPDSPHTAPTYVEVKLPGQPDFGTHIGHSAPVSPTTSQPRPVIIVKPKQMVDMRRYWEKNATRATGFDYYAARSTTNVYQPKVINIIEVDMTALRKAVEKSVNLATSTKIFPYDNNTVVASATTPLSPYNTTPYSSKFTPQNATYYSTYRALRSEYGVNGTKIGNPTLTQDDQIEGMTSAKYWDGSIYIESLNADFLTTGTVTTASPTPSGGYPVRRDLSNRVSGVRLINARGPIVTANATRLADTAHPCSPGLTLSTNDSLYLLGHFNADGVIYTPSGNPTTAQLNDLTTTDDTSSGNNSSLFPDAPIVTNGPTEQPVALVADAITILSNPTYDSSGIQTGGWSDELSHLTIDTSSYNNQWYQTPPSGSNKWDGASPAASGSQTSADTPLDPINASVSGNLYTPSAWTTGVYRTSKWPGASTEISAGFIIGLTPSAKDPSNSANDGNNSGGLHNLPRFLEQWSGTCAIRGSMVVMFESQVGWESWSLRVYGPPTRLWGFHNFFRNFEFSDDIPATRNIGITNGDSFQLLDQATYVSQRAGFWPSYSFPAP